MKTVDSFANRALIFPSILFITSLLTAIGYTNNQTYKLSQKVEKNEDAVEYNTEEIENNKEEIDKSKKAIENIKDKTEVIEDATDKIEKDDKIEEIIVEEVGKRNTNILRYLFISVVIILIVIIVYLIIKKRDQIKTVLVRDIPKKFVEGKNYIVEESSPYINIVGSGVRDGTQYLAQKGRLIRKKARQGYSALSNKIGDLYPK